MINTKPTIKNKFKQLLSEMKNFNQLLQNTQKLHINYPRL